MSLEEADEVAAPRSPFSTRTTDRPRPAASRAMPAPLMPPPMTRRSQFAAGMAAHYSAPRPNRRTRRFLGRARFLDLLELEHLDANFGARFGLLARLRLLFGPALESPAHVGVEARLVPEGRIEDIFHAVLAPTLTRRFFQTPPRGIACAISLAGLFMRCKSACHYICSREATSRSVRFAISRSARALARFCSGDAQRCRIV